MLPNLAQLPPEERRRCLQGVQTSLTTLLNCSFFITKDMRVDLEATACKGTLPLMLVFLARLGADIGDVTPGALDPQGRFVASGPQPSGKAYRVRFRPAHRLGWQEVYYFRENVSNSHLGSDSRLVSFCGQFAPVVTYLKSASYLMHGEEFSIIRRAILTHSSAVLEDDSGIPMRSFSPDTWEMRYFGNYSGVLDIFREYYQPALAQAFRHSGNRSAMEFGIGYKFETGQSCLILAKRRSLALQKPENVEIRRALDVVSGQSPLTELNVPPSGTPATSSAQKEAASTIATMPPIKISQN
jgi:hypothetical protein